MKFQFEYRSRDNVVHEGEISAANRDAAYAALKARGIKPSRLADAPGFFNLLFGRGKRWIVIFVLSALCVVLGFAAYRFLHEAKNTQDEMRDALAVFDDATRRQPVGDAAVIEKGIRMGWREVFVNEAERFLASFAIPGEAPAVTSTSEAAIQSALNDTTGTSSSAATSSSIEARQIIAMVNGLKAELRQYLADGGTIKQYGKRLLRRQHEEIGYYQRAKLEVETALQRKVSEAELQQLVDRRNEALRRLGIKPLVLQEIKRTENFLNSGLTPD